MRDISLSLTGLRNMRMLDSTECTAPLISESDWEDDFSASESRHGLQPIKTQEKLYFVEISKLALIGSYEAS